MTFHDKQRLGEIVAIFPGASNLFKAHSIDFCCGGGRPLAEALSEKGVAVDHFLATLEQSYAQQAEQQAEPETDWRSVPYSALIERIVTLHHAYLKRELPVIADFTAKIAEVHAQNHSELITLNRQFQSLKAELESHLADEESRLFPLVIKYEASGAREDLDRALECLEELESEHQAAGELLAAMRQTAADYQVPTDGCRTYTIAFYKLEELESDTFQHVHLENNILFQRLRNA